MLEKSGNTFSQIKTDHKVFELSSNFLNVSISVILKSHHQYIGTSINIVNISRTP